MLKKFKKSVKEGKEKEEDTADPNIKVNRNKVQVEYMS